MTLSFRAMEFAGEVHKEQVRKWTNEPYVSHLGEVAGIVASSNVTIGCPGVAHDHAVAVAWLHDCVEDQNVLYGELNHNFGPVVANGVMLLSDLEQGTRTQRKLASRKRLGAAPRWIQSIKVADIISNTKSVMIHDPKFAVTYLEEKRLMLNALTRADPRLLEIARSICK